ncbi:MAG: glucose-1-phosphate adenylyltransferase [Planctomycetaceae bacterium]|nr:glucose-1-phosphate adenylyltransferase [Planctomycetales bacterium]MCB9926565.1 glucose-1-phosphate adenylyltransferase [Planctomycetaceae bacterium]
MDRVVTVVLAGGKGTRLEPLTRDRAKPAVPFGGAYRIIDFTLSNCLNSGLKKILVLTQYKAMSLDRHINLGWRKLFSWELGDFIDVVPPQQRIDENWYRGTADAVYQNIYAIEKEDPDYVVILAGDHVYKMDYSKMVDFHKANDADVTVAALQVPVETAAGQFGVMEVESDSRIVGFQEKPLVPKSMPGNSAQCLASMGIYVFSARFMYEQLCQNAAQSNAGHDFGHNIIPLIIDSHRVFAFPFRDENQKSEAYWRDVGTLDAYYEANMDLVQVDPLLNVYDDSWPIWTHRPNVPPPKFVFAEEAAGGRRGQALDSVVCAGSILSGGSVQGSILGSRCRVNSYAHVEDSILFDFVDVGRHARIRRAIIDKGVNIPQGIEIGFDHEEDRRRGFTVSENGIVVIGKSAGSENLFEAA